MPRRALRLVTVLAALLAGCTEERANFSQHPGFAEWYAAHPPSRARPSVFSAAIARTRSRSGVRRATPRIVPPPTMARAAGSSRWASVIMSRKSLQGPGQFAIPR